MEAGQSRKVWLKGLSFELALLKLALLKLALLKLALLKKVFRTALKMIALGNFVVNAFFKILTYSTICSFFQNAFPQTDLKLMNF